MDLFFEEAVKQAKKSAKEGGIPIGSVIVHREQILGKGHNQRMQKGSVVLHGEMDALENAGRQEASTYRESTLYTTLSPCPMCTGAILLYGIPKVIIGENKTFMGAEELLKQHGVEVIVLQDSECIDLMETYIKQHPAEWNEDIGEEN
jgi:cytosine/creatinine deaminase